MYCKLKDVGDGACVGIIRWKGSGSAQLKYGLLPLINLPHRYSAGWRRRR